MPTERKITVLADLTDRLARMQMTVVADYRGLNVAEMTELRRKLQENGAEIMVAKNTLIRMAARAANHEELEPLLAGPTALTLAYDDVARTAKTLDQYLGTNSKISIRGGVLGHSPFDADGLKQVASMPSREQLLASILGGVQSPVSGVVGAISGLVSNIAYVVQARIDKLQGDGETAKTAA
jgi:large subunit ribosomal protein L10